MQKDKSKPLHLALRAFWQHFPQRVVKTQIVMGDRLRGKYQIQVGQRGSVQYFSGLSIIHVYALEAFGPPASRLRLLVAYHML